jgi:hypothetical protein
VEVFSGGTTGTPQLYLTVQPDDALSGSGKTEVINPISSVFNLDDD